MLRSLLDSPPSPDPLLPPWELRMARDTADFHYQRFWAEVVTRRLVGQHLSPDEIADAAAYKQHMSTYGKVSGDLLVGVDTVSELEDEEMVTMLVTSNRQWSLLSVLTDVSGGGAEPVQVEQLLFGPFPSSTVDPLPPVRVSQLPASKAIQ